MIRTALSVLLRGIIVAAAAGVAAFGLLVVFQPFALAPAPATLADPAGREALRQQIEALRSDLRATEVSLENVKSEPDAIPATLDDDLRVRIEAQIATAADRQDLALRQAEAIRAGLATRADVSALAQIRDSAVVGQLLVQRTSLDLQIAEQGARLRRNHPTMLALAAQRAALATQIDTEAATIASALETEAKLDAEQIALLRSQLPPPAAATAPSASPAAGNSGIEARQASQEAQLEALMDAYFGVPAPTAAAPQRTNPLSLANLAVAAIAALVALLVQLVMTWRRSRPGPGDLSHWDADADPEADPLASPGLPVEPRWQQAS